MVQAAIQAEAVNQAASKRRLASVEPRALKPPKTEILNSTYISPAFKA